MRNAIDGAWAGRCIRQLRVLCAWADEDEVAHMVDAMSNIRRFRRMDPALAANLFMIESGLYVEDPKISANLARRPDGRTAV